MDKENGMGRQKKQFPKCGIQASLSTSYLPPLSPWMYIFYKVFSYFGLVLTLLTWTIVSIQFKKSRHPDKYYAKR